MQEIKFFVINKISSLDLYQDFNKDEVTLFVGQRPSYFFDIKNKPENWYALDLAFDVETLNQSIKNLDLVFPTQIVTGDLNLNTCIQTAMYLITKNESKEFLLNLYETKSDLSKLFALFLNFKLFEKNVTTFKKSKGFQEMVLFIMETEGPFFSEKLNKVIINYNGLCLDQTNLLNFYKSKVGLK